MIAATAIAVELPLYTVNPSDFQGIDELDLRAVPHPDADRRT
jgi:tRNA(fMet)-specific endonuclease VapC